MAMKATVVNWRGAFGFAEVEGEEKQYRVRREDIDGGRLRVGLQITFDVVKEEDKPIRVTNVSGEGVLAKDAKLSEEELEADKKRTKEMQEKDKARQAKEFEAAWEKVEKLRPFQQKQVLAKLAEEFELGKEERRQDPTEKSGGSYTRGEFIAFYGKAAGEQKWAEAAKKPRRKARGGEGKAAPEREIVRE